jgi:DNA ligase (NAD+)
MTYSEKFLTALNINPIKEAKNLTIKQLEQLIINAIKAYYENELLISDYVYDKLIDYLTEIFPKSKVLKLIGNQPINKLNKVKLPYHLGSMDKIKPGSRKLELWFNKFNIGPYVISDKLDGLSGLLVLEKDMQPALYTRGDGTYGQDISHLLNIIGWKSNNKLNNKLPNKLSKLLEKENKLIIRGEIIINEETYEEKYSNQYTKSRSLIAGNVNSKPGKINKQIAADIEFISYQFVYPEMIRADDQFNLLKHYGLLVVNNTIFTESPKTQLDKILLERRNKSKYKIDGIIITDCNKSYINPTSGNPKHSIAFKMALSEQQSETVVKEVEYNISKNGILKPRIRYNPIKIDGDTLIYTTGFNAKFIRDNKIGPGSHINIIRSGDVIPYIKEVITHSKKWSEPQVEYTWSESGVDAVAVDLTGIQYLSKQLLHFFKTLKVDGMKIGTITKLINAGFDTIETILNIHSDNLLDIAGFNIKSSETLVNNIKTQVLQHNHKLEVLMCASNIFTGFGIRKLVLITDYLTTTKCKLTDLTVDKIITINGFNIKTAKQIINGIPKYIKWQQRLPLLKTIDIYTTLSNKPVNTNDKLIGLHIVFTGFRNKDLENLINDNNGKLQNTINSKTNLLIIKDNTTAKGSKYKKAQQLNITIITLNEFKIKYC